MFGGNVRGGAHAVKRRQALRCALLGGIRRASTRRLWPWVCP